VRPDTDRGRAPEHAGLVENAQRARRQIALDRVDDDHAVDVRQPRREVESRGAKVDHGHIGTDDVFGLERLDNGRTKAVVAHQHVSETQDVSHRRSSLVVRGASFVVRRALARRTENIERS